MPVKTLLADPALSALVSFALQEQATLVTVSRYEEILLGKEWTDLLSRLAARGVVPIDPDMKELEEQVCTSL